MTSERQGIIEIRVTEFMEILGLSEGQLLDIRLSPLRHGVIEMCLIHPGLLNSREGFWYVSKDYSEFIKEQTNG